jgi:hypothetical protein
MSEAVPGVDPAAEPYNVVLLRASFTAGDVLTLPKGGAWHLVVITAGNLTDTSPRTAGLTTSMPVMLETGNASVFTSDTSVTLRNEARADATALIIEVSPSWPSGRPEGEAGGFDQVASPHLPAPSPNGSIEVIAAAPEVAMVASAVVGIGSITLAPGIAFALTPSTGIAALAIETGTLLLGTTTTGNVVVRTGSPAREYVVNGATALNSGDSAVLALHTGTDWYASPSGDPVTLLIVTIATR